MVVVRPTVIDVYY